MTSAKRRHHTYFGYGSLVNRATRSSDESHARATLRGWQRCWYHRAEHPWQRPGVCTLTVLPAVTHHIDGVLATVRAEHLPLLDQRESGYVRLELPASAFDTEHPLDDDSVIVYQSREEQAAWASHDYPILQSYVDCVMAGFEDQYGKEGLPRFLETTMGWEHPLYNDRNNPLYSRAVSLTEDRLTSYDQLLAPYRGSS